MILESTARLSTPLEQGKREHILFSGFTDIGMGRRDQGKNVDLTTLPPIAQEPVIAPYYLVMKDK